MDIDKEELSKKFLEENWNYVFKQVYTITEFILISKFSIYDSEVRSDMIQECQENFFKKIIANKVDPNKNVFAFIWTNSRLRILEILRKQRNRNRIASFISYQDLNGVSNYVDFESNVGNRYRLSI